jgi:hypothetical protein
VRRLGEPGLGGAALDVASSKTEGRSLPRHATPTTATAGSGGEWMRIRWFLRGPPDEHPRSPSLELLLIISIIGRRA